MDRGIPGQASPRLPVRSRSLVPGTVSALAVTIPAFAAGGLAGAAVGAGHATWPDVAWLLAPALIALIQALAKRIAGDRRATRRSRHGTS